MSTNITDDAVDIAINQKQEVVSDTNADTNQTSTDTDANITASTFSNYLNLLNEKQGFALSTGHALFEGPDAVPIEGTFLYWISELHFMGNVNNSKRALGYTGHMIRLFLRQGFEDDVSGQGGEVPPFYEWVASSSNTFNAVLHGISAVYVPKSELFEGTMHTLSDNSMYRYWDDGDKYSPWLGSESLDWGDPSKNTHSSGWNGVAEMMWMNTKEANQYMNMDFTPDNFDVLYEVVYNSTKKEMDDNWKSQDHIVASSYGNSAAPFAGDSSVFLLSLAVITFFLNKL